jgi:hypothetical protein
MGFDSGVSVPNRAYWNFRTTIESIHQVHVRGRPFIVLGDRHSEQIDLVTGLKSMQHGKGQGIVNIVAHVGVEDDVDCSLSF